MNSNELFKQLEWLRQKVDEKDRLIEQLLNLKTDGAESAKKERLG